MYFDADKKSLTKIWVKKRGLELGLSMDTWHGLGFVVDTSVGLGLSADIWRGLGLQLRRGSGVGLAEDSEQLAGVDRKSR